MRFLSLHDNEIMIICENINFSYFLGKDGSHLPPKEVPDLNYAKLLKGCIAVIEEDLE